MVTRLSSFANDFNLLITLRNINSDEWIIEVWPWYATRFKDSTYSGSRLVVISRFQFMTIFINSILSSNISPASFGEPIDSCLNYSLHETYLRRFRSTNMGTATHCLVQQHIQCMTAWSRFSCPTSLVLLRSRLHLLLQQSFVPQKRRDYLAVSPLSRRSL